MQMLFWHSFQATNLPTRFKFLNFSRPLSIVWEPRTGYYKATLLRSGRRRHINVTRARGEELEVRVAGHGSEDGLGG